MIASKKEFYGGMGMLAVFVFVLVIMFSPVFKDQNGLEYLDSLYNSISKASAYYIPNIKRDIKTFTDKSVSVTLNMSDTGRAQQTVPLFETGGAQVTVNGSELKVAGNLRKILENCLADADAMYHNLGDKVSGRYGYDERQVLYNWWKAFKEMDKDLKAQKKFQEAKAIELIVKKAVEPSYNYYKIEPQKIVDRLGIVIFSLLFLNGCFLCK